MKPQYNEFVSPETAWASLEELKPLSAEEVRIVSNWLSEKHYCGYEEVSVMYECDEVRGIEHEFLPGLISFLQKALQNKKEVFFELGRETDYSGEYPENKNAICFIAGRDMTKFYAQRADEIKRNLLLGRRRKIEYVATKEKQAELREQIRVLTTKFSQNEISLEDFGDKVSALQKEIEKA